jgi:hypothetical protein
MRVTYTALADGVDYNPFDWQVFVDGVAVDNHAFVLNGPEQIGSGTLPSGRSAPALPIASAGVRGRSVCSVRPF